MAAFANDGMTRGTELEDIHIPSITHPGAMIIPAVLAAAEKSKVDGRIVVTSIVHGYDVMLRLAYAIGLDEDARRGIYGEYLPSLTGVFGAALGAGIALGLDSDRIADCLGIASTFAGGKWFEATDGISKLQLNVDHGRAAQAGLLSALMAREDLAGPRGVFEGKNGLLRLAKKESSSNSLFDRFGERAMISEVSFKRFSTCHCEHNPLEAFLAILSEHNIQPDDIDSIEDFAGLS